MCHKHIYEFKPGYSMLNQNDKAFLSLLSTAIWQDYQGDTVSDQTCSATNWQEIFAIAESQGLSSVLFDAFEIIPSVQRPPLNVIMGWAGEALKQERMYDLYISKITPMLREYTEACIPVIMMKGISYSEYYPKPKHRTIGDIDIFIDESDRTKSHELMAKIGAKGDDDELVIRHDSYKHDGLLWEIHIRTMEFHTPSADKVYARLEKEYSRPENLVNKNIAGIELRTFSPVFNVIYNTVHIQRHLILEFVTMRQLCDWALLMYHEREVILANREKIESYLKELHLTNTFKAIAYIAHRYLNLPDIFGTLTKYNEKDTTNGEFLLRCILEGKVPGCNPYQERYLNDSYIKKARLLGEQFIQCYKLRNICGTESLYAPIVTIRNFIQRRLHK